MKTKSTKTFYLVVGILFVVTFLFLAWWYFHTQWTPTVDCMPGNNHGLLIKVFSPKTICSVY